ncbi:MAG: hypothetical protein ACD_4C00224G0005 [uncultured bacterium (gcode 4)]|uniref:HIT domain-containing protein n=1 Tax=uncultured bacterium (gcode 4) TaxID=1234023 RepID=K2F6D4_9BACT|nr:MAG: hypothetical protein ACD_4C00224G0005 [uncultured bacterium (gcode 4)]
MAIIYETANFIVESHEKPEIDRLDWWHIKISPKENFKDRFHLSPKLAIELMRLTIIAWKAMIAWLWKNWIKIWRINFQDNWNWNPELHIHLYWRAIDAKYQKFWNPVIPWNKAEYNTLNEEDLKEIRIEIEKLFKKEKFKNSEWWL